MPPAGITLRLQTEADLDFAEELYASTRAEELAQTDWPDETKRAFLHSQFAAQWNHYSQHYHDADFMIIERDGSRIGRLYVWESSDDVRIVDIAIVSEARGAGIGGALLREIMDRAASNARGVSIHVERFNPALRLYQRLGFREIDEHGAYYLMKWMPSIAAENQPKMA
jgi:ribosomal protein S18 acetylase RimI-like enzyme